MCVLGVIDVSVVADVFLGLYSGKGAVRPLEKVMMGLSEGRVKGWMEEGGGDLRVRGGGGER